MSVAVTSINEMEFADKAYFPRPSYTYHIANQKYANIIFGGLLRRCHWWDFKLADFSTVWRDAHACDINGLIMA